jgi:hypothetical protein
MKIARSFNCGFDVIKIHKPRRGGRISRNNFSRRPCGLDCLDGFHPQLKLRAIINCPSGMTNCLAAENKKGTKQKLRAF